MKISELQPLLQSSLEYPITRDEVLERIGDVSIEAPIESEAETVQSVLVRVNDDGYTSSDELYCAIVGSVGHVYVGRRFYDDRGSNPLLWWPNPEDRLMESF